MKLGEDFISTLLFEEESTSLDFKESQYQFDQSSDDEKSELLKDILAFCNSWRRSDAYILIGVRDVKGGKGTVIGITKQLDDASLQQFVNSKTNRPVEFSYNDVMFEGKQIGLIHIPVQQRPIYLKKDFGKLKKNDAYIRRGSSTDVADLDEVSRMGISIKETEDRKPRLKLQFADSKLRKSLSNKIYVESLILDTPDEDKIPDFEGFERREGFAAGALLNLTSVVNRNYNRDLVAYTKFFKSVKGTHFSIENEGSIVAADVRLEIEIPDSDKRFLVRDECDAPENPEPHYNTLTRSVMIPSRDLSGHDIEVRRYGESWHINANLGKIQPKETIWVESKVYFGAIQSCEIDMNALLYADNLPEPISTKLIVEVKAERKKVDFEETIAIYIKDSISSLE
jgi:Schlafen, AlbA_2